MLEALKDGPIPDAVQWSTEGYEAERKLDAGTYRQRIGLSRVGVTTCVDEGSDEHLPL